MDVSKNKIAGKLRMRGLSIADFARQIGEEPNTVRKVIDRAARGHEFVGDTSLRILRLLKEEMEFTSEDNA